MKFRKPEADRGSKEGSSQFIKIADGESVNVVLRGEVYDFHTKWADGKSSLTTSDDPEGRLRHRVNAVVYEQGKFISKILEFGKPVYEQLGEINAEYPLETIKIKISRRGVKLDTTYMVLPLLGDKDKLTPKQMAEIESVQLQILEHKAAAKEQDQLNEFGF